MELVVAHLEASTQKAAQQLNATIGGVCGVSTSGSSLGEQFDWPTGFYMLIFCFMHDQRGMDCFLAVEHIQLMPCCFVLLLHACVSKVCVQRFWRVLPHLG